MQESKFPLSAHVHNSSSATGLLLGYRGRATIALQANVERWDLISHRNHGKCLNIERLLLVEISTLQYALAVEAFRRRKITECAE